MPEWPPLLPHIHDRSIWHTHTHILLLQWSFGESVSSESAPGKINTQLNWWSVRSYIYQTEDHTVISPQYAFSSDETALMQENCHQHWRTLFDKGLSHQCLCWIYLFNVLCRKRRSEIKNHSCMKGKQWHGALWKGRHCWDCCFPHKKRSVIFF